MIDLLFGGHPAHAEPDGPFGPGLGNLHCHQHMGESHRIRMAGGPRGRGHFQADFLKNPVGFQTVKGKTQRIGEPQLRMPERT